ncbi:hypothetical protein O1O06_16320 [Grimontia hollisae]|uniref:hypothetical protein n=1 Tax=Grimontia hollisae TaxID=673 RepID=UPI0023DC492C|nr:hypothetical protein [Grimontia hollisae]MDF2186307.1 hypothetical protein [Grimontia hollisae]
MRSFIAVVLLTFSSVAAAANTTGKSLDQFFVMASDFFQKAVIVDPNIDGKIRLYGVDKSKGFKRLFYSVLKAHDLDYQETSDFIRVSPKQKQSANPLHFNQDAVKDFILNHIRNVYITGSLGIHDGGKTVTYDYTFAQSDTRKTFKPDNIGLEVVSRSECMALLRYGDFTSVVTCEPYLPEIKGTSDDKNEIEEQIELALNEREQKRKQSGKGDSK